MLKAAIWGGASISPRSESRWCHFLLRLRNSSIKMSNRERVLFPRGQTWPLSRARSQASHLHEKITLRSKGKKRFNCESSGKNTARPPASLLLINSECSQPPASVHRPRPQESGAGREECYTQTRLLTQTSGDRTGDAEPPSWPRWGRACEGGPGD